MNSRTEWKLGFDHKQSLRDHAFHNDSNNVINVILAREPREVVWESMIFAPISTCRYLSLDNSSLPERKIAWNVHDKVQQIERELGGGGGGGKVSFEPASEPGARATLTVRKMYAIRTSVTSYVETRTVFFQASEGELTMVSITWHDSSQAENEVWPQRRRCLIWKRVC